MASYTVGWKSSPPSLKETSHFGKIVPLWQLCVWTLRIIFIIFLASSKHYLKCIFIKAAQSSSICYAFANQRLWSAICRPCCLLSSPPSAFCSRWMVQTVRQTQTADRRLCLENHFLKWIPARLIVAQCVFYEFQSWDSVGLRQWHN